MNVMKEREIDTLGKCQGGPSLISMKAAATIAVDQAMEDTSPDEYDEVVITKKMETVEAFSSCVIPMKVEKANTGKHINAMTQALEMWMALYCRVSPCKMHTLS